MKKLFSISVLFIMLSAFCVCAQDGAGGTNTTSTNVKPRSLSTGTLLERQGVMMDDMISILEGAGDDGVKAAKGLIAYELKNADAIKKMQADAEQFKLDMQKDPKKAMSVMKDAMALMQKATKLAGLMEKFQKDPAFMDAVSKLN